MTDPTSSAPNDENKYVDFDGFYGETYPPTSDTTPSVAAPASPAAPIPSAPAEPDFGKSFLVKGGQQTPSFPKPSTGAGPSTTTGNAPPPPAPATRLLDITLALTIPPKPRDFALPCLRAGTVGGLVSPGGAGKSMLAAQLALMVATGLDTVANLRKQTGWENVQTGLVHYASFEDGEEDAATRLHGIWRALGAKADAQALQLAAQNLSVETLTGLRPPDLLDGDEWGNWLLSACQGKRLVLIDTLRMAHLGDENDSGAMARLMAVMQGAAMQTGAAILFLHHVSKGAALSGQGSSQQAARGSSVLTDNARGQFFLSTMSEDEANQSNWCDPDAPGDLRCLPLSAEDPNGRPMRIRYVKFGVAKSNYSAPWPDVWLRRDDHGVLSCANLAPYEAKKAQTGKGHGGGKLV